MKKQIPYGVTPIGTQNAVYKLRFKTGCDSLLKEINLLSLSCEAVTYIHKGKLYVTVQGCIPIPNIQHLYFEINKHLMLRDIKNKFDINGISSMVDLLNKEINDYIGAL